MSCSQTQGRLDLGSVNEPIPPAPVRKEKLPDGRAVGIYSQLETARYINKLQGALCEANSRLAPFKEPSDTCVLINR